MNINLLPWRDEIIEYNKKILTRLLIIAVICSSIFLVIAYNIFFSPVTYTKSYMQALEEAKVNLIGNVATYLNQKKMQKEIAARFLVLQNLQMSRFDVVRLLNEIVKTTPKGVYLSTLIRKDDKITLSGSANSNLLVSDFMTAMRVSPNIEVTSLEKVEKTEGDQLTVTHFDLHAALTLPRLGSEVAAAEKAQNTGKKP